MAAALPDHYTGCEGKIPYPGSRSPDAHRRFQKGFRIGFKDAEASWILEDILMMCRLLEAFGGKPYKTYRLFEREV